MEGERVYILEWHNSDWWFVRKHLTEETGWVPAQYLKDDVNYTMFVKKKLEEKIDKLPVFEASASLASAEAARTVSAPRFGVQLKSVQAPDGHSVTFECQVEGHPRPIITWFRQTAVIKPSPDFQAVYDEEDNVATLTIAEVFPEDAGTFTCVAKNAAGFASSSAELVVQAPLSDHGCSDSASGVSASRRSMSRESSLLDILEGIPPTFSQRPKTKTVEEGTDVELECRLVAVPEPEVSWFHNGKRIKETERVSIVSQADVHMYCSIIQIGQVEMSDEGTYDIIARNREGEALNHVILNVKVRASQKTSPPCVVQPLQSQAVDEHSTVQLAARVSGQPAPTVKWYRNGVELVPGANVTASRQDDGSCTLTVQGVTADDDGEYVLEAANEHGRVQTSAFLSVEQALPAVQAPKFLRKCADVTVDDGLAVTLTVDVDGQPVPEVVWYRNGKRIKSTKSARVTSTGQTHTLHLAEARVDRDAGEYKCVASNAAGKTAHSCSVHVNKNVFVELLRDAEADEESDVLLKCVTKEATKVVWWHDDEPLNASAQVVVQTRDKVHTVMLRNVAKSQSGTYRCTFDGSQATECNVWVHEPLAEFVRKLADVEVNERQQAVFSVQVSVESAAVTWHRDGEPIDAAAADDRYQLVSRALERQLVIRSASIHDEGEYTCSLGEHECTAELVVIELPPEIIQSLSDVSVLRGQLATFDVELTKGDARVRWFKGAAEIQFSEHVQLAIDGKRQRLMVYDCRADDASEYSCTVGDQKSVARLSVAAPAVDFTAKLADKTTVPLGQDVTLTATLTEPDARVVWTRNGDVVVDSDRITSKKPP